MNNQMRLEVQAAVRQWAAAFMEQYQVPASMLEDALNKVIIDLKDQIITELMIEAQQIEERKQSQEPPTTEESPQEQEE